MKDIDWRAFHGRNFRRFILPGVVILIGVFVLFFALSMILKNINVKRELLSHKEAEIEELVLLCRRYTDLRSFNSKIDQRISKNGANFELLSFLEEISKRVGVSEKISSMKPSEGGIDEVSAYLVIKNLSMDELTEYLNLIMNSGKVLLVKKMHLRALDKVQRSLEASLVISTLKSPEEYPSSKPLA